jgi:predicted GIY-YIG superfamily endonuclease
MSNHSLIIRDYPFPGAEQEIASTTHGTNWPVVYLIYNDDEVYVGETTSAFVRYSQHADRNGKFFHDRRRLKNIKIVFDDLFNKSAILDIEQNLIHLLEAEAAIEEEKGYHGRKLQNRNAGQSYSHNYYNRTIYQAKVEEIWDHLFRKRFVKNPYAGIKNSDLFKYSPYTSLTAEQELVCRDIIRDIISKLSNDQKGMALIKGVAGTGKSLVLINMIMTLLKSQSVHFDYDFETDSEDDLDERYSLHAELERFYKLWKIKTGYDDLKIGFVVPMASIRATFRMVFKYSGKSTKGMRASMVIGPNEVVTKKGERDYDVVYVDEYHRLKRRVAMSGTEMGAFDKCCQRLNLNPKEATHLDFLLKKSRYQILVYDENQSIKPTDIPVDLMRAQLDAHVTISRELKSQMRCQGGGDFMK